MRDRRGKLMNLRDSKRVAEIERNMARWDELQLMRSGVVERVAEEEDEEERERVMLVVNSAKPPFLDGRHVFTKQMDPVLPLKDPTSDMAVVARRGSKLVMQVRACTGVAAVRTAAHGCVTCRLICAYMHATDACLRMCVNDDCSEVQRELSEADRALVH